MVDREVQTRAKAMREKDTVPPPRRVSGFPPARPPPPITRAEPPAVASRPPPPAPPAPLPPAVVAVPDPAHSVAAARSAATLVRPRPSQNPPSLPSFAAALAQRVRFAGGEVPLWSLVTPLVVLVALGTAFAAAAVTAAAEPSAMQPALKVTPEPSASSASTLPVPEAPSPTTSANDEKPKPATLLERAAAGDDSAVKELSTKPAPDLRIEEAIALSRGQSAQHIRTARTLRERVAHDPGLIKDAEVLSALRHACDDPETARDALATMADIPGPISADLIYDVWTSTASHTAATDLARSLMYSQEVRAKASKALSVALDLRDADTCDKNRDLLPRATADGDRRAFHVLNKLTRKYGCGPGKRQDCYPCLRDGQDLDGALKAVKARHEPHPFGGG